MYLLLILFYLTISKAESNITGFASYGNGTYGGENGTVSNASDVLTLRALIYDNVPKIIYVTGLMNLTSLFNRSSGVMLDVGSYKTIIGKNKAEITGGGLRILNRQQVIIRNITFTNAISYAPGERPDGVGGISYQDPGDFTKVDAIRVQTSIHVWIDHNEFTDDPWKVTEFMRGNKRHDGLVDIIRGSNYVTVSNNVFRNHDRSILIGNSDMRVQQDRYKLKVTLVGNWFNGTVQRNPRVRFGEVHVLNNLYTNVKMYGVGIGVGARIYSEGNVFEDCKVAYKHPNRISQNSGCLKSVDTLLFQTVFGKIRCTIVDWSPLQYYNYTALNSSDVKEHVMKNAGVISVTRTIATPSQLNARSEASVQVHDYSMY